MNLDTLAFDRPSGTLAGSLVLPESPGLFPGVVLLHGAMEGTRDFYRAHAAAFADAGIATLAFDRRGEGDSSGKRTTNLKLLADDAVAAVNTLRSHPRVAPQRVGLWGYSNGAWVAALAASRVEEPAFLAVTGASAVSPAESEVFRRTSELRSLGIVEPTLAAVERTWRIVFTFMASNEWQAPWDTELAQLRAVIESDTRLAQQPVSPLAKTHPNLDAVPRFDGMLSDVRALGGSAPDFGFDPMPVLRSLTCPILIVEAENDSNLPIGASLEHFRRLADARPGEVILRIVAGANHSFTTAQYSASHPENNVHGPLTAGDFLPGYLEAMGEWMATASQ